MNRTEADAAGVVTVRYLIDVHRATVTALARRVRTDAYTDPHYLAGSVSLADATTADFMSGIRQLLDDDCGRWLARHCQLSTVAKLLLIELDAAGALTT